MDHDGERCPKQHERAARFCLDNELEDLFGFVGLEPSRPVAELPSGELQALAVALQERLTEKRRWAQSQQSNPKFRTLAKQYIAAFNDILAAAQEPATHEQCIQRQRDALGETRLGPLIAEQLGPDGHLVAGAASILRSVGKSFKMSEAAIDRLLAKHGGPPAPVDPPTGSSLPLLDRDAPTSPRRPLIDLPPLQRTPEVRQPQPARPDFARRLDSVDPRPRTLHSAPTAPPVRREFGPTRGAASTGPQAPTPATPIGRERSGPSSLRHVGQRNFAAVIYGVPAVVAEPKVEFTGPLPPTADLETHAEWLIPDRGTLDPLGPPIARIQSFKVFIDPKKMPADRAESKIVVRSRTGETLEYHFEVERRFNWKALLRGMGLSIGVAALALLIVFLVRTLLAPTHGPMLIVRVDPTADAIVVDGQNLGPGPEVQLERPRLGARSVIAVLEHFETAERTVDISATEPTILDIALMLDNALDFAPAPSDRAGPAPADGRQRLLQAARPCLDEAASSSVTGSIDASVIIRTDGLVAGIRLDGSLPDRVRTCLRRRIAAVRYDALPSGDYAEVRARLTLP